MMIIAQTLKLITRSKLLSSPNIPPTAPYGKWTIQDSLKGTIILTSVANFNQLYIEIILHPTHF